MMDKVQMKVYDAQAARVGKAYAKLAKMCEDPEEHLSLAQGVAVAEAYLAEARTLLAMEKLRLGKLF